jgi:hypothetical protein
VCSSGIQLPWERTQRSLARSALEKRLPEQLLEDSVRRGFDNKIDADRRDSSTFSPTLAYSVGAEEERTVQTYIRVQYYCCREHLRQILQDVCIYQIRLKIRDCNTGRHGIASIISCYVLQISRLDFCFPQPKELEESLGSLVSTPAACWARYLHDNVSG